MNKTQSIIAAILELIINKKLKTGDTIPSLRQLSAVQNSSTFVAKKAVEFLVERNILEVKWGHGIYIKTLTAELKDGILQELTRPQKPSRTPVAKNAMNLIAFITRGRQADFFGNYLPGISDVLKRENFHFILEQSNHSFLCEEDEIQNLLHSRSVKGFIIDTVLKNKAPNYLNDLKRLKVPAIFIGDTYFGESIEVDRVLCDNRKGMTDIMEYVISQGHRHIAYVGTPEPRLYANQLRHSIYTEIMQKHGLKPQALPSFSEDAMTETTKILTKTQSQSNRITALVCCGDGIAFNCIKALKSMGLRVPDDVSVTGFDNRRWTEFSSPTVTTVHYPREEVGARAAEILIQKINDTLPLNNYQTYLEEPNIIIRESVRKIN